MITDTLAKLSYRAKIEWTNLSTFWRGMDAAVDLFEEDGIEPTDPQHPLRLAYYDLENCGLLIIENQIYDYVRVDGKEVPIINWETFGIIATEKYQRLYDWSKDPKPGSVLFALAQTGAGIAVNVHFMPQAARHFLPERESGAIIMPHEQHILTRTYGVKGYATMRNEEGLSFRSTLVRDIKDVRRIGREFGNSYNHDIQKLLNYYKVYFPSLMVKDKRVNK